LAEPQASRPETALARALGHGHAVVVVAGPMGPDEASTLCEQALARLAESDADVVVCDVGSVAGADLWTVDALARLALVARRLGRPVMLRDACPELLELVEFAGLAGVVPCLPGSGRKTRR
jgi:NAD(P)-dependent dehydrogenase (short-subunit alcohol dehydrogenase family)